ncbi:hypothetical protein [Pontibacter diazotrophicus]|nr:hypothetical protein [Pontibacter diazotrophicus]
MDRRDRNRYDRDDYGYDYSGYKDYDRNDEHYHSARNLTDTFEQDYQRHRGRRDDNGNRMDHTYHEGNMGDFYERRRGEGRGYGDYPGIQWSDQGRSRNDVDNFNRDRDRDRYSNNLDDFRGDQDRYRGDRDRSRDYGNRRSYDRYGTYDTSDYGRSGNDRDDYFGAGDYDRSSRYEGRNYGGDSNYTDDAERRSRYGSDRRNSGDSWLNSNRRSYLQDRYY